ncbi:transport-associated protein [Caballeronia fortuita]|uniref:Transport-associated protein n=1 Tax=Caballeronia fortuita TaxID=1777138 RepID=A0A158DX25_9BURK|nr:BON domain-containing protein [Caballeronia fortuita]SAK99179.1 transport-associated protein [Caballeronia fortuita]
MKTANTFKLACAALIVALVSANACSQTAASAAQSPTNDAKQSNEAKQSNRAVRRAVYAAFAKDKAIDAGSIGVSAKNGVVTLTGTVGDAAQIDKAGALAKSVPGVVSVRNKLTVRRAFNQ